MFRIGLLMAVVGALWGCASKCEKACSDAYQLQVDTLEVSAKATSAFVGESSVASSLADTAKTSAKLALTMCKQQCK
jgi:hypothetical protein